MATLNYSPEVQYAVLRAIHQQCGIHGERPISLEVEGVVDTDISRYVHLLKELQFVEAAAFKDPVQGTTFFPVSLTVQGMECLAQTDREFWTKAQDAATEGVKVLTGVDLAKFADFFKAVYDKYRREKGAL